MKTQRSLVTSDAVFNTFDLDISEIPMIEKELVTLRLSSQTLLSYQPFPPNISDVLSAQPSAPNAQTTN